MKLIILGKHTKDKGNQLEQLTKLILESKGYKDINTNILSSGGEIDVTAYYEQPSFAEPIRNRVICECKALDDVVNITAWHKFIGKLHIELMSDSTTKGVMIAMSGVNGHVSGSYDDIKQKDNRINLITGDQLYDIVKKRYDILEIHTIQNYIFELTHKRISSSVVLYYDNNVYWAVMFGDGLYSIINKDGSMINSTQIENLCLMLEQRKEYAKYLNLEDESEYQKRQLIISKLIFDLLLRNNSLSVKELQDKLQKDSDVIDIDSVPLELIEQIVSNNSLLCRVENVVTVKEISEDNAIEFLQFILEECTLIKTLELDVYQKYIDENLLRKIVEIQKNIFVEPTDIDDCLFLLKYSPAALRYALRPDLGISIHAIPQFMTNAIKAYTKKFRHSLMQCFISDFHNHIYHKLYNDVWGINTIDTNSDLTIYKELGDAKSFSFNDSITIVSASNIEGNPFILCSHFDE